MKPPRKNGLGSSSQQSLVAENSPLLLVLKNKPRVDSPLSPIDTFKSTKDPPPTPFNHFYCNSQIHCPVSPAYRPTSPAYLPTSLPYVPTSLSYHSVSSTTLSNPDTQFLDLRSLWGKEYFFWKFQ